MSWFGAFKLGSETDPPNSVVGIGILNVTNVVQDGCIGHVAAVPQVGPTVDDMATALAALTPFVLTKPPTDVTVDGFSGKHLELTVPDLKLGGSGDDTEFTDCTRRAVELHREAALVRQPLLQPSRPVRGDLAAGRRWHAGDDRDVHVARFVRRRHRQLRSILDSIDIVP